MTRQKQGVTLTCVACSAAFYVPVHRQHSAKFCSRHCQNVKQHEGRAITHNCKACGEKFTVSASRSRRKYCSSDCRELPNERARRAKAKLLQKAHRGNNSGRVARKIAFALKPAACEVCNYSEYTYCLDVHHVDNNPQNNTMENLAILCVMCHRMLHKGDLIYPRKQAIAISLSSAGKSKEKKPE